MITEVLVLSSTENPLPCLAMARYFEGVRKPVVESNENPAKFDLKFFRNSNVSFESNEDFFLMNFA